MFGSGFNLIVYNILPLQLLKELDNGSLPGAPLLDHGAQRVHPVLQQPARLQRGRLVQLQLQLHRLR